MGLFLPRSSGSRFAHVDGSGKPLRRKRRAPSSRGEYRQASSQESSACVPQWLFRQRAVGIAFGLLWFIVWLFPSSVCLPSGEGPGFLRPFVTRAACAVKNKNPGPEETRWAPGSQLARVQERNRLAAQELGRRYCRNLGPRVGPTARSASERVDFPAGLISRLGQPQGVIPLGGGRAN